MCRLLPDRSAPITLIPVLVTGIQLRRVCAVKRVLPPKDLGYWIPVTSTGMRKDVITVGDQNRTRHCRIASFDTILKADF
ncbi:hypothetical protein GGE35_003558 [Rhizobium cellulosilyticum]|uniref:Uncharacterized protein n=1 Tax=Aliirhizobium cellulosilyticum TaxID=393664 RepID=A0A7W6XCW4_9HYPH|nr:hypothetical protein [Rhizobium cellulosilyticum]MBB4413338.1 hypothetical protein [Rhizobium cellulosilyticum]MBB4447723.1 hypothetical protein [Rhizobium cellulosilyticum]